MMLNPGIGLAHSFADLCTAWHASVPAHLSIRVGAQGLLHVSQLLRLGVQLLRMCLCLLHVCGGQRISRTGQQAYQPSMASPLQDHAC